MAEENTMPRAEKPSYKCLRCCQICNDPRQLPCFHSFCTPCLDTYIRAEHVIADNRTYVPCPVCEGPCSPPDPETPISYWASSFPLHPVFASTSETLAENGETFCDGCLIDDDKMAAEFWCPVCMEAMCKPCRVVHRKNKILSQHKVIDICDIKKTGFGKPVTITTTCPQHTGKELEVYCLDHNALCCVLCVTLSHRSCQDVRSLDDMAKKTTQGYVESELDKVKDETKTIEDEDKNAMTVLDSDYQTMTNNVTAVIQTAKNKLDDLHARFQCNLNQTYKRDKDSLSDRLSTTTEVQANLDNTSQLLKLMSERGTDCQKFIVEEQSKSQLARHLRRLQQKTKNKHNTFNRKFKLDDTLEKIINVTTTLGIVEMTSSLSSVSEDALASIGTVIDTLQTLPSLTSFADSTSFSDVVSGLEQVMLQAPPGTQRVDVWTGSLSLVKSVQNSTLGGLYEIILTGGVFIDGEGMLLVDTHNKSLLLFDDQYNYVRQYDVDGKPIDITRGFTANEVLVLLDERPTILQCTMKGGDFNMIGRISIPANALDIAVLGDNILIGNKSGVHIITTNGTLVKSMSLRADCPYTAVSPRGDFYHTDGNDIVCRSRDGKEVFRHTCQGLRGSCEIAVDQDSNVYVCGQQSWNVQLVSADGSRERSLLSNLPTPYTIMVHPTRQECIVMTHGENVAFRLYKFCDQ